MVSKATERSRRKRTVASPLDRDKGISFVSITRLSQLNGQFCKQTETHCPSYGDEYVQKIGYALPARQVLT